MEERWVVASVEGEFEDGGCFGGCHCWCHFVCLQSKQLNTS
jgi:hypothetical protein